MTVNQPTGITPAKLRSGAPDALAALSASRGAAVFAYCQRAVGRDDAVEAAAEAFAQLRIAILPPGSLTSKEQAEQLLRSVMRRTALSHLISAPDRDHPPGVAGCADRGSELLGYIEKTLTPADRSVVAAHIGRCQSCAEILRRLQVAENAFKVNSGTEVPHSVAREILTALATAAPVAYHDGDAIAVRNEALLLLDREAGNTATDPAPAPPCVEKDPHDDPRPAEEPPAERPSARRPSDAPRTHPRPRAAPMPQEPPPAVRDPGLLDRLRSRTGREHLGPSRTGMLLCAATRVAVVVATAGAAGILLGVGIAALTGADGTQSSQPIPPTESTPAVGGDRLRVDVASTTVTPASIDAVEGARVRVRVTVQNSSARAVRPQAPRLLVDDIRIAPEPASAGSAAALLAPALDAGATAKGTLRFDLQSRTATELAAGRVRLRIAGKVVVLEPVLAEPTG